MWPNIRDVAREAGVSLATVSRVLNKTKHVEPELEQRVLDAVEKLQYRPNQHARWLSSKQSNVIGLIMPSVDDSNRAAYLQACSATLRSRDFEVMVGLTSGERELERELASAYVQSHASGIIFTTLRADRATRELLDRAGIPVLLAWAEGPIGKTPSVRFDTVAAVSALVSRLEIERYARVRVLSGRRAESESQARAGAMEEACMSAGARDVRTIETDGSIASAYTTALGELAAGAPDLIVCTSDYLALGVCRAAHERGMRVPDDLAVTGFGRSMYAQACVPSLTTVELDAGELGRISGESMVRLVRGQEIPSLQQVGHRVVAGGSCPLREESWRR